MAVRQATSRAASPEGPKALWAGTVRPPTTALPITPIIVTIARRHGLASGRESAHATMAPAARPPSPATSTGRKLVSGAPRLGA